MERHIVQYKPRSSTLYSTNHPHQSCVLYCTVLLTVVSLIAFKNLISLTPPPAHPIAFLGVLSSFSSFTSCFSSRVFINFVTKPQSSVACRVAVLTLHFLALCENKILSLSSPCSGTVTFMELYLHASQPLVLYCTPFV